MPTVQNAFAGFIRRSIPVLIAGSFLLLHSGGTAAPVELFVSPQGSDGNPGSAARPLSTLQGARDRLRVLRQQGALRGGATVWIRQGDYFCTNSLELSAPDGGMPRAPISFRAWKNETVRLIGGQRVRHFGPVTDEEIRKRLSDAARPHVVEADLRREGIRDFGKLSSRGFGRPTTPAHLELFWRGKPMTLARWPNEGSFARIAGFPSQAGAGDGHGGNIGALPEGFFYSDPRPDSWKNRNDVWVHGYWAWDWANSYEQVESIDTAKRLIKTAPKHGLYGFRKNQRFYFLNILEELDQPGEWYLDRESGKLYFWPPGPDGASGGEALVSILEKPIIQLDGVSHVVFQGMTFEAARGDAIQIRNGSSNRIDHCAIQNMGNWGVLIEGGAGNGVVNCEIFDTGDGGVSMTGGNRQTLVAAGHFVDGCHFARQGRWSKCYVPAVLVNGVGNRVTHCLIHDHPHCAILFTGNDHTIDFNEIHHIAMETGDVGAIYAGRDWTYRGNRIRFNYIHETGGVGMGSMGVYMDDCVSGAEIVGNIFWRVHRAVFLGGGRDHRVENNLFVDCEPAVELDGRGLDKSPVWRGMVDDTMRQSLFAMPPGLYRARYPALVTLDRYYGPPAGPRLEGNQFAGIPPEGNVIVGNVCKGRWFDAGWNAKKEWVDVRDNLLVESVDLAKRGFGLKQVPANWKKDNRPVEIERIGKR